MFLYEHKVVSSLLTTRDDQQRVEVTAFVSNALGAMPEFLRLGIAALSVGLTAWDGLRRLAGVGRSGPAEVAWLKGHRLGLVRQWVRALQTLVLFAENEKMEAASCA